MTHRIIFSMKSWCEMKVNIHLVALPVFLSTMLYFHVLSAGARVAKPMLLISSLLSYRFAQLSLTEV